MTHLKLLSDQRLNEFCAYCGNPPETRDHVPSKILLENPFPINLPVVPCCNSCNQGFSLDEEYFACIIECVLCGTTEINQLRRDKIKAILSKKENLRMEIENSFLHQDNQKFLGYNQSRFENVILKLAKGHVRFENSESVIEKPTSIVFKPLLHFSEEEHNRFFYSFPLHILPEVGSRGLSRVHINHNNVFFSEWIEVQEDVYRYCVIPSLGGINVRILIWNYLAVEVIW